MIIFFILAMLAPNIKADDAQLKEAHILFVKKGASLVEEFNKAKASNETKKGLNALNAIYEMGNIKLPRELFSMCKKLRGADCTVFKARAMEHEGNSGSAMELYLRSGMKSDYTRLKALSGQDIEGDVKDPYYVALSAIAKGDWKMAASYLSKKEMLGHKDARFNLFYAFLMSGAHKEAKELAGRKTRSKELADILEQKKMEALLLYADNEQYKALKLFKEILKYDPSDYTCLRYIAQIYYRTGWYDVAEKIYDELISAEWRDTELYSLLTERCEMRVRYLKLDLATKDAEKIIKEFPDRSDFLVHWISWLLEYGYSDKAEKYISRVNIKKGPYNNSLALYAEGLLMENRSDYENALSLFKKADQIFPANEYRTRALIIEEAQALRSKNTKAPSINCKDYKVQKTEGDWFFVESGLVKYYIKKEPSKSYVVLKVRFIHDDLLDLSDRGTLWTKYISSFWSSSDANVNVVETNKASKDVATIDVVPWPSSLYLKRISSHEWSVLTPYRVIAHESGHLFGMPDEYYESDERIKSRNLKRYIGEPNSIMRNMLSGMPQKRHIQFLLSSLQCTR